MSVSPNPIDITRLSSGQDAYEIADEYITPPRWIKVTNEKHIDIFVSFGIKMTQVIGICRISGKI